MHNVQVPGSDTVGEPVTTGNGPAVDTEDACQLAEAMWSKFAPGQLMTTASKPPMARFSQLVSQLGMHALLTKLAGKMQVVMQTWLDKRSMHGSIVYQNTKGLQYTGSSKCKFGPSWSNKLSALT